MADSRPPHLAPGTIVGDKYTVEGLVRLAEERMFYLANDGEGNRFLMSARWKSENFDAYEKFYALGLEHPGLAAPVDVVRSEDQLFSLVPYNGEGLMVDEASPLSNARVLDVAQRVAGTLAFLHLNGVEMGWLRQANLLISPDNAVRVFDPEVVTVHDGPVPDERRAQELQYLGLLLKRYCDIEADPLSQFMVTVENGSFKNPATFGRAVEQRFDAFASQKYDPRTAGMSDVGLVRSLNEDNWGWRRLSSRAKLYVVADGMGGHDAGEVASDIAVKTWCKVAREKEMSSPSLDELEELVEASFIAANNAIKDEADSRGTDMGTTLVGCYYLEDENVGFVANVGDSRCYLHRGAELIQVSKDHSLVAKMVERGRITEEEALTHPHSNILLRTVGTERDVEVDVFRVEFQSGDKLLMCSDGLWGEVRDKEIENILNTYSDLRLASRELIRASHHGGGKDNVTLMVFQVP